jgi:hypothetical protein
MVLVRELLEQALHQTGITAVDVIKLAGIVLVPRSKYPWLLQQIAVEQKRA